MKKFVTISSVWFSYQQQQTRSQPRILCVHLSRVDFVAIHTNVIFMIIHQWLLVFSSWLSVFSPSTFVIKFRYLFYRFLLNRNWNWIRLCKYKKEWQKRVLSFCFETTPFTHTCLPEKFTSQLTGTFWLLQNQQFNILLTHFFRRYATYGILFVCMVFWEYCMHVLVSFCNSTIIQ